MGFGKWFLWSTLVLTIVSCSSIKERQSVEPDFKLEEQNWHRDTRLRLDQIVAAKAGQNLPVVFDFDNTLISRDIGEATFAQLASENLLNKKKMLSSITPEFSYKGRTVSKKSRGSITRYYEDFLNSTLHQSGEAQPYANGYLWVVQIMKGYSPFGVIRASERAYDEGSAAKNRLKYPGQSKIKGTGYRRPFFNPEMVDLVGLFLKSGYDVWVVSASNVWTVRWMVTKMLNSELALRGVKSRVRPDRVIGVSTLLRGPGNRLYKDPLLVRKNDKYADLNKEELKKFRLTTQPVLPVPAYHGKVANILKHIGDQVYFAAGDSPNDHPMLTFAQHKLWIARLEKEDYQRKTVELIRTNQPNTWLIQPTLYKKSPGFISHGSELATRFSKRIPEKVRSSVSIIQDAGHLSAF